MSFLSLFASARIQTSQYVGGRLSHPLLLVFLRLSHVYILHFFRTTPIILMLSEMHKNGKLTIHFPKTESSNMKQKQYNKSRRNTLDILIQLECCKIDGNFVNGNLLVYMSGSGCLCACACVRESVREWRISFIVIWTPWMAKCNAVI